jgi:hypothetical protein
MTVASPEIRRAAAGRKRAARAFPILGVCEYPPCPQRATDRHHLDGDPANSSRANLRFLCRRHHRLAHCRPRWQLELDLTYQMEIAP